MVFVYCVSSWRVSDAGPQYIFCGLFNAPATEFTVRKTFTKNSFIWLRSARPLFFWQSSWWNPHKVGSTISSPAVHPWSSPLPSPCQHFNLHFLKGFNDSHFPVLIFWIEGALTPALDARAAAFCVFQINVVQPVRACRQQVKMTAGTFLRSICVCVYVRVCAHVCACSWLLEKYMKKLQAAILQNLSETKMMWLYNACVLSLARLHHLAFSSTVSALYNRDTP